MELKELEKILNFLRENKLYNTTFFPDATINKIKLILKKQKIENDFSLSKDQENYLINFFINNNFIITRKTPYFILENKSCLLSSIKNNIQSFNTIGHLELELYKIFELDGVTDSKLDFELFKLLLLNNYKFPDGYLADRPLKLLKDKEILNYYLNYFDLYQDTSEEVKANFLKLIQDILINPPKIKDFSHLFNYLSEKEWQEYKQENSNIYSNIFGKICSQLRIKKESFCENISTLNNDILIEMKLTLKEKYQILLTAMEEYYNIYHSNLDNKLKKIQKSQDIIAKISALYIAKTKENHKKGKLGEYYNILRKYYELKEDSQIVKKKILEKKQKEKLKDLYLIKDSKLLNFLNTIILEYGNKIEKQIIKEMIEKFIMLDIDDITTIVKKPLGFDDYSFSLKVLKIVNRLNNHYLTFTDLEVLPYKDFISYNKEVNKYVYTGVSYSLGDINKFNDYNKLVDIFKKIRRDIMIYAKTFDTSLNLPDYLKEELKEEIPFTDDNYYFKSENLDWLKFDDLYDAFLRRLTDFNLTNFLESISTNEAYKLTYNLLVNNNFIWFLIILNDPNMNCLMFNNITKAIPIVDVFKMFTNMNLLVKCQQDFNLELESLKDFLNMALVYEYLTPVNMAILGFDLIKVLASDVSYTNYDIEEIIKSSVELISLMSTVNKKTVPYLNGTYLNYQYSMYDSQDNDILLAGIKTDSCFKVCGNDSDFLFYTALNKNGFVIKITDCYNNFIGRASGFRNGNCVYLNQLRTIYDLGGANLKDYPKEKEDIIETLKKACYELVKISQENKDELVKIDFVFINQSYMLNDYPDNVSDELMAYIGANPMDTKSEDWKEYLSLTDKLDESYCDYFTTDYGEYPLICLASIKPPLKIVINDLKSNNPKALYQRKRNEIVIKSSKDLKIRKQVNRIKAIKAYLDNQEFRAFNDLKSIVILGDNWYIILKDREIIDTCILNDKDALYEYQKVIEYLKAKLLEDENSLMEDKNLVDKVKFLIK